MIYYYKRSLFDPNVKITLTGEAIETEGKEKEIILYKDITSVNLFRAPSFRGIPEQFFCIIRSRNHKKIHFGNRSFLKPFTWDDKSNQYVNFVTSLHNSLKGKNIQFELGNGKRYYILFLGFLLLGIIGFIIIAVGAYLNNRLSASLTMGIVAVVFAILTPTFIKGYKYGNYDPYNLPEELLPRA